MKKNLFILAVATLLMVGCDKGADTAVIDPNEIRVEASMQSRASATTFEIGDKMALYAVEYNGEEVADIQVGGNFINGEALTYNGTAWAGERTLYWSENPCDFYGIYPYQEPNSMTNFLFELHNAESPFVQPLRDIVKFHLVTLDAWQNKAFRLRKLLDNCSGLRFIGK